MTKTIKQQHEEFFNLNRFALEQTAFLPLREAILAKDAIEKKSRRKLKIAELRGEVSGDKKTKHLHFKFWFENSKIVSTFDVIVHAADAHIQVDKNAPWTPALNSKQRANATF